MGATSLVKVGRRGPVSGLTGLLRHDRGTDDVRENQEERKGRDTGSELWG